MNRCKITASYNQAMSQRKQCVTCSGESQTLLQELGVVLYLHSGSTVWGRQGTSCSQRWELQSISDKSNWAQRPLQRKSCSIFKAVREPTSVAKRRQGRGWCIGNGKSCGFSSLGFQEHILILRIYPFLLYGGRFGSTEGRIRRLVRRRWLWSGWQRYRQSRLRV